MIAKPMVIKRDGHWRIISYFGTSPILYDTWREAFNQALRYA